MISVFWTCQFQFCSGTSAGLSRDDRMPLVVRAGGSAAEFVGFSLAAAKFVAVQSKPAIRPNAFPKCLGGSMAGCARMENHVVGYFPRSLPPPQLSQFIAGRPQPLLERPPGSRRRKSQTIPVFYQCVLRLHTICCYFCTSDSLA
jgi:hypothetical protein